MASARYATLCSPDAPLHGSDLLHWQTLRCLSGLGLLHPEIFIVSRPALRRLPVFRQPSLGHQRNASPSSSADLLFGASQFCVSLPWVIKGSPHLRRQPTCSSAPPSFCVSLPWVIKGTPHPLRELETRKNRESSSGAPQLKEKHGRHMAQSSVFSRPALRRLQVFASVPLESSIIPSPSF